MSLKKQYRIFYVTSDSSEVKQLEFRTLRLGVFVFFSIVILLATSFVLFNSYLSINPEDSRLSAELERLREENQAQKFHIQRFAGQISQLNQQMERLQNFYAKLKIMANIDLHEYQDASMATGGPQPQEPEMSIYLEKSLKQQIHRIHWEMEELHMQARIQEQNAYKVEKFFDSQRSLLASTPTIWPIRGWITSPFGHRVSPFTGTLQMHDGLDICARLGTPIKATAAGVIIYSGWKSQYGKTVTIDHGYGYLTRYAHMSKIIAKNGQRIKRGEIIGNVGSTGRSTGPHLHYEVRVNGLPVDPKKYLLN